MPKQKVNTSAAPAAIGPYSQAIRVGDDVYCSGQIALDPGTMQLVGETAEAKTEQVFRNLRAVLEAAGSDLTQIVKCTIFLIDLDDFASVNAVYAQHLSEPYPARSTVEVSRLPKGARVEIEAIARMGGS